MNFAATELDLSFLQDVTLWQAGIVIVAAWIVIRALVRFWPGLRKTINLIDAIGELPQHIEDTKNNVKRVEDGVAGIYGRLNEQDTKISGIDSNLVSHIADSKRWKIRLDTVEERTQPPKEIRK